MKTFATERAVPVLLFTGSDGRASHWVRAGPDGIEKGVVEEEGLPVSGPVWLVVPAAGMTIRFVPLPPGLTEAQAVAAARLKLSDQTAEPIGELHAAVGHEDGGARPVALLRPELMDGWLAAAKEIGVEPSAIIPAPLLIPPPDTGYQRFADDHRGPDSAFTLEPDLAALLIGDEPVIPLSEAQLYAQAVRLERPPLDLRQGVFALRRPRPLAARRVARIALLLLALGGLTLGIQVATLLGYTFAADRLEAEAEQLAAAPGAAPPFGTIAEILFDAIRATPSVELVRLGRSRDGRLSASLLADTPATLDLLRRRLEASAVRVRARPVENAGGRPALDILLSAS